MAIDRIAVLRDAEKLLRQGKLEAAIVEYLRVVQDHPRDWNTANTVGDLYVRAGQTAKAVEQFTRLADSLSDAGFLPKAGALYKKILKLKPDHEHALLQGAEIAAGLGLLADARNYLNNVAERRRARGDKRGVLEVAIRLGSLDPTDFNARMGAAAARVDIGDAPGAVKDLKAIAAELVEQQRQTEAFEALRRAALIAPDDADLRARLLDLYLSVGDYAHARECAATVDQLKALADVLDAKGLPDEAIEALRDAARLNPDDTALQAHIARAFVARGDMAGAAEYFTLETAGADLNLLLQAAEIQLRAGKADDGLALARRLLEQDPSRRDDVALLGWSIAEEVPYLGLRVVDVACESAVAQSDWPSAAAALQEFVTRVPNHIPALLRLVEVCVDGGLEATMYAAQAQLADAYITAGCGPEARFIAEDLVAREPWESSNIERFRRALVLIGEPDPDGVIAERLSGGQTPFMSTDLSFDSSDLQAFDQTPLPAEPPSIGVSPTPAVRAPDVEDQLSSEPAPDLAPTLEPQLARPSESQSEPGPEAEAAPRAKAPRRRARAKKPAGDGQFHPFELGANSIDVENILSDLDTPKQQPPARVAFETVEVDLSTVLDDIKLPPPPIEASDPDGMFEKLRGEAARRSNEADMKYKEGLALHAAGRIDESLHALQAASVAPRLRFQTGSLIGRIYRDRGMVPLAVEWFERAAQAPAPTASEGYLLLYELAVMLESLDEVARALAIYLELQAEIENYRDVDARVDRLSKVQTRG